MNIKKVKAVLFDMDGTVLDTEPIHKTAWETAMEQFGLKAHWDLLYRCIGLSDAAMKKLFFEQIGLNNFDEVYTEAGNAARKIKSKGIAVKKGFPLLNEYLKANNIKSAIVTSSTHEGAEKDLARAGILESFDLILGFGDYEESKPSPEPYLKAAELLGFTVDECLAAEDSENGLLSASHAGIKCVYIRDIMDIPKEIEARAYRKADNLLDVINIIEKINNEKQSGG